MIGKPPILTRNPDFDPILKIQSNHPETALHAIGQEAQLKIKKLWASSGRYPIITLQGNTLKYEEEFAKDDRKILESTEAIIDVLYSILAR